MLEIIALIFLSKNIAGLAERKGLKRGWWRFYTVLAWVAAEFIGAVAAILIFQSEATLAVYLFAIVFAVASYFLLKAILSRKPDVEQPSFEFEGQDQQQ
ncbi:MAG TPA: hypothetical protein VKB95_09740 [Chitinophagaceae bacterium]|nr:hypothetical protein [Chitinophagaceae bacterium]